MLDELANKDCIVVADRAYFQIERSDRVCQEGQLFVIRLKTVELTQCKSLKRVIGEDSNIVNDFTAKLGTEQMGKNSTLKLISLYVMTVVKQNCFKGVVMNMHDPKNSFCNTSLINGAIDAAFFYSSESKRIFFSEAFVKHFHSPETIDKPTVEQIIDFIVPENKRLLKSRYYQFQRRRQPVFSFVFNAISFKGIILKFLIRLAIKYDPDGNLATMEGVLINLDEASICTSCSYTNSLTGLPNRKAYNRDMFKLLKEPNTSGHIILVDLDNLSQLNSMYSHAAGDKAIWFLGKKITTLIKNHGGEAYHFTGGEFLILLPNSTAKLSLEIMVGLSSDFSRDVLHIDKKMIRISISSGTVAYYGGLDSADNLLLNAEIAVQKSKQRGKNNYGTYERGDDLLYWQQFELTESLKQAVNLNCEGFQLYYQPIFSANHSKCIGAEALLRWISPKQELIQPNVVVPILEQTDLMATVEQWILNTACAQLKHWNTKWGKSDFFIHVNLSPKQITRDSLFDEVMTAIDHCGISPNNLVLETTETSMMLEFDKGISLFKKLRETGTRIAIDDFGTGYSSLSYLKNLPVDEIKIDRSFVRNITTDISSKNFLTGIINIIKSMDYSICIEGVETEMQKSLLTTLQVDSLQGFLFSKPVPAHEFERNYIYPMIKLPPAKVGGLSHKCTQTESQDKDQSL